MFLGSMNMNETKCFQRTCRRREDGDVDDSVGSLLLVGGAAAMRSMHASLFWKQNVAGSFLSCSGSLDLLNGSRTVD